MTAKIKTTCPFCGKEQIIEVEEKDYEKWRKGGLIQSCFSYLSADEREALMTGICNKCWDETFKE